MIRFRCIYCGQRILARDDGYGKRGKCPNCQHILVVPKTTKGRPAISWDKEPMPDRSKRPKQRVLAQWERDINLGPDPQADAAIELFKESFGFLVPTYDKLSILLMVVTLILLFVINIGMRDLIHHMHTYWRIYFLSSCMLCFGVCIYHAVISNIETVEEADYKNKYMLFSAVLGNAAIGIIAGVYVLRNAVFNWLLVFPIWNIINSILLLLMFGFRIIDEDCISDRKATFFQIILGLIAVMVIFVLCNYIFKLYWAITFSICIVYTTSFDRALQNVFPGLMDRGDD